MSLNKNESDVNKVGSSRRSFLKKTGLSATALAVPYLWVPSPAAANAPRSANDRLRVGSIGTSIYANRYTGDGDHPGRGAVVGHQAGTFGEMVAVADVNKRNAEFFADRYDGECQSLQRLSRVVGA